MVTTGAGVTDVPPPPPPQATRLIAVQSEANKAVVRVEWCDMTNEIFLLSHTYRNEKIILYGFNKKYSDNKNPIFGVLQRCS
jgi:hypothetical protein